MSAIALTGCEERIEVKKRPPAHPVKPNEFFAQDIKDIEQEKRDNKLKKIYEESFNEIKENNDRERLGSH